MNIRFHADSIRQLLLHANRHIKEIKDGLEFKSPLKTYLSANQFGTKIDDIAEFFEYIHDYYDMETGEELQD